MEIFVCLPTGRLILLHVKRNDTHLSIKKRIDEIVNISTDRQRLFFDKKGLHDDKILDNYNVEEYVVLQLRWASLGKYHVSDENNADEFFHQHSNKNNISESDWETTIDNEFKISVLSIIGATSMDNMVDI